MSWIGKQFSSLKQRLFQRREKAYRLEYVEELPDSIRADRLYLIGSGQPWFVALECPCGCGSCIQLSLLEFDSPRWTIEVQNGLATIVPSIWRTQGCEAHFFVRGGNVEWCGVPPIPNKHKRSLWDRVKECFYVGEQR